MHVKQGKEAMEISQAAEIIASQDDNVIALRPPRPRRVPPLTDDEITQLRDLLMYAKTARTDFELLKAECPLALRVLSTR
jgi:hypothetical protein